MSVRDIRPLSEAGVGIDGGEELSVSRVQFHSDIDSSQLHRLEYDPTIGDWSHIENVTLHSPPHKHDHAHTPSHSPSINLRRHSSLPASPSPLPSLPANTDAQARSGVRSRSFSYHPSEHATSSSTTSSVCHTPHLSTYLNNGVSVRASSDSRPAPRNNRAVLDKINISALPGSGMGMGMGMGVGMSVGSGLSLSGSSSVTSTSVASSQQAIDLASFISDAEKAKASQNVNVGSAWVPGSLSIPGYISSGVSGGSAEATPSPTPPYLDVTSASAGTGSSSVSVSGNTSVGISAIPPHKQQRIRPSAGVRGSKHAPPFKQSCRVLVVEDSLPNRKLLLALLTRLKCRATGVEDGQQCVDLFQEFIQPDSTTSMMANAEAPISDAASTSTAAVASASTAVASAQPQHPNHLARRGTTSSTSASETDVDPLTHLPQQQEYPFDIILMDGTMPIMNGVVATQILRRNGITIPIVAVTGNALAEDVSAFMLAGADSVLTKPVNALQLQQALARFCPPNT